MKTILILIAGVILASCNKSTTITDTTQRKIYIRIESVELDGQSSYSPISSITVK